MLAPMNALHSFATPLREGVSLVGRPTERIKYFCEELYTYHSVPSALPLDMKCPQSMVGHRAGISTYAYSFLQCESHCTAPRNHDRCGALHARSESILTAVLRR